MFSKPAILRSVTKLIATTLAFVLYFRCYKCRTRTEVSGSQGTKFLRRMLRVVGLRENDYAMTYL